jgi:hypothetical protein
MASIDSLLAELEEKTIAQRIGIRHDEARMRYSPKANTVTSFDEFTWIITDYYNHHFTTCVSHGGRFSQYFAASEAKMLLGREYRRQGGDIITAYNNAHDGTNGGMRSVLDVIAEGLKARDVENYILGVFDRYVTPNSWEQKVDIIVQFIDRCGVHLASSIQTNHPERYASNYRELIDSYVSALRKTSSVFRRF